MFSTMATAVMDSIPRFPCFSSTHKTFEGISRIVEEVESGFKKEESSKGLTVTEQVPGVFLRTAGVFLMLQAVSHMSMYYNSTLGAGKVLLGAAIVFHNYKVANANCYYPETS